MRKLLTGGLVALVALLVIGKTTNLLSYTGTLWSQAKTEAKRQIPTKFELDRIRHEIRNLDSDVDQMIRPIAEYKVAVERLRTDVTQAEARLDEQKKVLLTMTEDLKGNHKVLFYNGKSYSPETVKTKLSRDFESFKRAEAHLTAQRKLLEAKESSLAATQEQLVKVLAKKREYEVRLAELEAREETLQIARIGNVDIKLDSHRATQIEQALRDVEDRQNTEEAERTLKANFNTDNIPVTERAAQPGVDVDGIRAYLRGENPTQAASK